MGPKRRKQATFEVAFPVPYVVSGVAGGLLDHPTSKPEDCENIRQLLTDTRMKGVWRELYRRKRSGGFLHRATPAARKDWIANYHGVPEGLERQDLAVGMLYFWSCFYSTDPLLDILTVRPEQAAATSNVNIDLVSRLRFDASTLRILCGLAKEFPSGFAEPAGERHALAIERAADFMERRAKRNTHFRQSWVVRDRGHRKARGFVIQLSTYSDRYFGQKLFGVLATIASIVTGQNVSRAMVREWLRVRG